MTIHWPESDPYAWVTNVGLDLSHFYDTMLPLPDSTPDTTGYYSIPLQLTRFSPSGPRSFDLGIVDRSVHLDDVFMLCNMTTWAKHYGLTTPWPFLLTTALGIFTGRDKDQYRPDPSAFTKVLHSLGIETSWRSNAVWWDAYDQIVNTLSDKFPLCARNASGVENPAFVPLAQYLDLHLSAYAFFLTTLIEHSD